MSRDDVGDVEESYGDEITELHAELAALRKDAERYRWLRRQRHMDIAACYLFNNITGVDTPEQLDAAIDAAIEQERKP